MCAEKSLSYQSASPEGSIFGKLVLPWIREESGAGVEGVATQFPSPEFPQERLGPHIAKDNAIDGAHQIRVIRIKHTPRATILLVRTQSSQIVIYDTVNIASQPLYHNVRTVLVAILSFISIIFNIMVNALHYASKDAFDIFS